MSRNSNPLTTMPCVLAVCALAAIAGCSSQIGAESPRVTEAAAPPLAPALEGLGTLHYEVSTMHRGAQRFFDQGLRLLYAFNHDEALRAFREAARLDPGLAMAHWGQAMALGPNLNAPMSAENGRRAFDAVKRARSLAGTAAERERALSRR